MVGIAIDTIAKFCDLNSHKSYFNQSIYNIKESQVNPVNPSCVLDFGI